MKVLKFEIENYKALEGHHEMQRTLENPAENRAYYSQIQMNLLITGRDYAVFKPRLPDFLGITIQPIMADHAMMEEIRTTLNWAEQQMNKLEEEFRDKTGEVLKSELV